ncbi:transmembrane protein 238-like [Gadus macrocephalus]|uniref:transmembrane protein 238-like n=1 Tax=Gadus macrocephalus TaxID=80720 RepID=UPI0028CB2788|nr:transmembrane protein 238-like [Gadus macrocephalus]
MSQRATRTLPRSRTHHPHISSGSGIPPREWTEHTVAMSTEVRMEPVTEIQYGGVGRCKCSFWFAVAHDVLGLVIMMMGVFGGFAIHDLLIYAGSIILFFSLIWWVFWYSGNIDVPPGELEDDVGMVKMKKGGLTGVVRSMSSRVSSGLRSSFRRTSGRFRRDAPAAGDEPQHRESRPSTGSQMRNVEVALSTISEVTESTAS